MSLNDPRTHKHNFCNIMFKSVLTTCSLLQIHRGAKCSARCLHVELAAFFINSCGIPGIPVPNH